MKKYFSVKTLVASALLVALNIVFTRLLSIDAGPVRIGFGFIPIAFGSMLFGIVPGTIIAIVADLLGALLDGAGIWLGFTFSAALYGVTYAYLFHREKSVKNIAVCVVFQAILIDALMGALWYFLYTGMDFLIALLGRSINAVAMIPIKIITLKYLWKYVGERLKKQNLV